MSDTTTITVTRRRELRHHRGPRHPATASATPARRARKVLIVHPPTLGAQAEQPARAARRRQREVLLAEIPDAEQGKRVEVAAFCWQVMGQADFTRTDAVIGFGGGAVTDLAGFVAATWLRGVAGRAGADDRARHGRRRRRRQDRHQHRRGQEPRRRVLAAARGGLRPRPARRRFAQRDASPASPRWSRRASSGRPRSST